MRAHLLIMRSYNNADINRAGLAGLLSWFVPISDIYRETIHGTSQVYVNFVKYACAHCTWTGSAVLITARMAPFRGQSQNPS